MEQEASRRRIQRRLEESSRRRASVVVEDTFMRQNAMRVRLISETPKEWNASEESKEWPS